MPARTAAKRSLQEIRRRAAAGLPMSRSAVRNTGLFDRARRDFGTWAQALAAAGVRPLLRGRDRKGPRPAPNRWRRVTEALLRGPLPTRAIARLTGRDRRTIREMRQRRGVLRGAAARRVSSVARTSHAPIRLTERQVVERGGRRGAPGRRRAVRRTAPAVGYSFKIPTVLRLLRPASRGRWREAMRKLDRRWAEVLRRRFLSSPGETLEAIGRSLRVSRQRVAQIEAQALRRVHDLLAGRTPRKPGRPPGRSRARRDRSRSLRRGAS